MSPRGASARARGWAAWTVRHGRALWMAAVLIALPAGWRTVVLYTHLRTELEELLPRDAPSVKAIAELRARLAGVQHLGIVVDAGTAANLPAAEHLVDDLAERVRAYPPGLVSDVRTDRTEERKFLEAHAPLYVDLDDLRTVRGRLEARRDWEVARETGALLDTDEPAPPVDFSDLRAKYQARLGDAASRTDRFSSPELHLSLMLVETSSFDTGRTRGAELLSRVKNDLASLGGPDAYARGMRVGYAGDIAIGVEETSALREDLSLASVLVVLAVGLVIVLYYRWWLSGIVLVAPLAIATVCAFAVASLPPFGITKLNSNTAFLGAIIIGNGINFGIVLLARYVEERRAGAAMDEAMATAVGGAHRGTLAAALAAGVSYASLVLTDFRGFRQFGVIGGLGMVLSWVLAFLLVPSLCIWLDRGTLSASRRSSSLASLAGLTSRWAMPVALVAVALTSLAMLRVGRFDGSQIESDFSRLRRADTWTNGEGYWGRKMEAVLGTYLTPIVLLTDDVDTSRKVATRLREAVRTSPLDALVATVRTIDDVVPGRQAEKIAEAEAIRETLTPKLRSLLTIEERRAIERWLGSGATSPVAVGDVPRSLTVGLRERDGSVGKTVLVFPRPSRALWNGPTIAAFVGALRAAARVEPPASSARVAGALPLSADILERVRHDGPLATAAAFVGVAIVVVLLLRQRPGSMALVLVALGTGVVWTAGLAMALGIRLNFANFIAFPITFGIGVDYSVNIMVRHGDDGGRDLSHAVATTGGAVALCSATTVLGYASLLMAQNRALMLFGLLAVLGECCCLVTALVALPAWVQAWQRLDRRHAWLARSRTHRRG